MFFIIRQLINLYEANFPAFSPVGRKTWRKHGNFYFSLHSLQLIQKSMWNRMLFVAICAMNYSCFCCGSVLLVDIFLCIVFFLILSPSACFNKTQQNWALLLHLLWNFPFSFFFPFFWYICLFISTFLIILALYCYKNVLSNVLQRIFGDLTALSKLLQNPNAEM